MKICSKKIKEIDFFSKYVLDSYCLKQRNSGGLGLVMVFNATFNNISVISWRSVLLVEEIGVHGKNHRPEASH